MTTLRAGYGAPCGSGLPSSSPPGSESRAAAAAVAWLTAYLLEMSLSVDNLFIFILIFSLTGIPANLQSRALFWESSVPSSCARC